MSDAATIEYFHIALLQILPSYLDREHYVLKGGANLRYFFGSERYSEDIDLDAVAIKAWNLEDRVDRALASSFLRRLLGVYDMGLEDIRKPKQTDTTQRWKLSINMGKPIPTKIEFSHRSIDKRRILEAVPAPIVESYALRPPTLLHYTADAAIEQKIGALAGRSETQARDVFDLELLLRTHREELSLTKTGMKALERASELALELPFDALRDQVLPFLDEDIAAAYTEDVWEQMKDFVGYRLMELI